MSDLTKHARLTDQSIATHVAAVLHGLRQSCTTALKVARRLMSIIDRPAADLLRDLDARKVSSVELTQAYLDQIQQHDGKVKAFLLVDPDAALARAKEIDDRRAAGKPVGKLGGLPVAIKDVICTQGVKTTCASKMLQNFVPPYDATVVDEAEGGRRRADRQDEHGRVRDGRLDRELAPFKTTNPWDLDARPRRLQRRRGGLPGGGHGAAVDRHRHRRLDPPAGGVLRRDGPQADVRPRQPLWPGRVRQLARPDRPAGPLGRGLRAAAGSARRPRPARFDQRRPAGAASTRKSVNQPLQGLKLGLVREHFGAGLDGEIEAAVREAVKVYQSLGATVKDVSMPHSKYGIATYYIIAPSEASSNLARYDGVHYGYRTDEKADARRAGRRAAEVRSREEREEAGRPRHAADPPLSPDAGRRLWPRGQAADHARHLHAQSPATTTRTTSRPSRSAG